MAIPTQPPAALVPPLSASVSPNDHEKGASIEDGGLKGDSRSEDEETQYPPGRVVFSVAIGLYIAMFLVSLVSDRQKLP